MSFPLLSVSCMTKYMHSKPYPISKRVGNYFSFSVRYPCEVPLFSCLSGQCINMTEVQDEVVHCDDASDEGLHAKL